MVKVCGITRAEDAAAAYAHGAWALGAIFAPESPRCVDLDQAHEIFSGLPDSVARVGVFVDPDPQRVVAAVEHCSLSLVQIHRCRDIAALNDRVTVPIVEVVGVRDRDDIDRARRSSAALVLLDAVADGRDGGTGTPFDWSLLEANPVGRPFMLAGGLGPENVAEAIRRVRPDIVDLNSGVESAPGIKDYDAIARAMAAVASTTVAA